MNSSAKLGEKSSKAGPREQGSSIRQAQDTSLGGLQEGTHLDSTCEGLRAGTDIC